MEPYGIRRGESKTLRPEYFESGIERWSRFGLFRCQAFTQELSGRNSFEQLHAVQLLKHLLGLGKRAMEQDDRIPLV
jgi:hypothetical protein